MDKQLEKKFWSKKRILIISGSVLLVILFLLVFVFGDHSSKLNVEKDKLTICEVKTDQFQDYIPVSGTIEPFQTFYLDLSDGGRVVEKYVEEGAFLNVGDPIIRLENQSLAIQVMNTQSSFMQAEAQLSQNRLTFEQNRLNKEIQMLDLDTRLRNQKRTYDINKNLYAKKLCSFEEYERSREDYENIKKTRELMIEVLAKDSLTNIQLIAQSQANMERSKKYLQLNESQLAGLTVRAPIKGQLTSLKAEIGENVGSGYKLGQIDNTDSYKIRADVDEHYISKVHAGLTAEYEFDNEKYKLIVKTVYPQVTNGKFSVDLIFAQNQPDGMRRGQTVNIRLELGNSARLTLIESGGFFTSTGGQWIYVVDKSGSFAVKRNIKIGRQNPQYYEVLEGLKSGEKVITSSYDNYGDIEKLILK